MPIDLSNKVAVVTGGSGALGRVMVRTLAEAGADIAICYHRDQETARLLEDEITAKGVQATIVQADVTNQDAINAMRDAVVNTLGAADIIVNNAVIQYNWTSVLEQSPEDYESQFQSCVLHNVYMAQAFVPAMIEAEWGRVISINTECSMQNFAGQSAYTSGKRGMDGMLRVLAKEVGVHGITVNQVAPGWTISEKSAASESDEHYWSKVPMQRRGTAQEIANAVLFLASDLASYITGAYIPVCGGNVMPTI
ncbi:short-chain dehydrogenase [Candidatus Poribacteria bacterium]|nr:MAG: short-chain dehydrogenase [Candidatus Poribacteria bacterium]